MEENPNQHIGPTELAKLLEGARCRAENRAENREESRAESPGEDGLDAVDLHRHLAVCSTCREQFEELAALDRQFKHLRPVQSVQRSGDCPQATVWREIAAGLPQSEETLAYIGHASHCDHCAPLLREAVLEFALLNRELTEDERKQIASLESAGTQWQEKLARRITLTSPSELNQEPAPWWQNRLSLPRLVLASASLIVVVGVGSWIVFHQIQLRHQPAAAESLLARAYTKKRTIELRIAGADFASMKVTRGEAGSFTDRPKELLNAEALIDDQLESQPTNPAWLQAKAEADMLEGRYEPAVEGLRRAVELEPHSAALLTDLATAYFQRGLSQDKKDDLGAAYENLSKALELKPNDPIALFNRAIVSEHLFLYHQALDDWNHYLSVDPGSQWAQEARSHFDAVQKKLKEHSNAKPLLSPDQLAAVASGASPPSEVDQRIEEYLDEAVRSWLPAAFPEVRGNEVAKNTVPAKLDPDPNALRALFFLADLTSQHHRDNWLADLLRNSSTPHFPQAVVSLARSVEANSVGEYDVARQQADLAEQQFRASGNMAGVLRAQFEQTFSAQMERRSEDCRRKATAAGVESRPYSYLWVEIQLGLEESVCSALMVDVGNNENAARRAAERARQSGYGALYLRALGFLVGNRRYTGDGSGAGRLVSEGLDRYWSGQFPAMRGYNLYVELAYIAEASTRPRLRLASWREATSLIDTDSNLFFRAMAHQEMAEAATAADVPGVAEHQFKEAARLFAAAPHTEASQTAGLENEIRTARLEALQDESDHGIARLTTVQDEVRGLSNNYVLQMFYSTLGELQLHQHRDAEAEQAFVPALALAEQSLATLRSESERARWSKNAAQAYLALSEAKLVQGRPEEALEMYERYLGAPYRMVADRPPQSLDGSPVRDSSVLASHPSLPAKETALVYAVLPDGLAIWVYDDRGVHALWIPTPTGGLQELAERFYDLSSDPGSELSALRRDARSLYGTLIAPVEQYLTPGRTLVIEAEGWPARVPFEALLDSNDHYLIERVAIVHSLGRDSQARLRSDTGISPDLPALVVGSAASSSADGLIPIPDVAAEADTVASGLHSAHILEGRKATLRAVRSELPKTAIFHFAGHSMATLENTGLMLESGDGQPNGTPRLMGASVVRQLHLQSLQLAVLSACSTASGSGGARGFDSITDAFLRAGVPHVVASRWAVDSAATRGIVQDFYRNALSGQSVSEAIRLTSLKMLASRDTSHPYYRSAFAAYGRP